MSRWPTDAAALVDRQRVLAGQTPSCWHPAGWPLLVGACFVCFPRGRPGPGTAADLACAAAVLVRGRRRLAAKVATGTAGSRYEPGLLALREGPLLAAAVAGLPERPEVLLVNATGRDHPRRAGLALHLGAELDLPTIGVTHRLLLATGGWPADEAGATSPFAIDGEQVGCWLRTRAGTRPVAVHAGWRVDPDTAAQVVWRSSRGHRTPEPLREARRLARTTRATLRRD